VPGERDDSTARTRIAHAGQRSTPSTASCSPLYSASRYATSSAHDERRDDRHRWQTRRSRPSNADRGRTAGRDPEDGQAGRGDRWARRRWRGRQVLGRSRQACVKPRKSVSRSRCTSARSRTEAAPARSRRVAGSGVHPEGPAMAKPSAIGGARFHTSTLSRSFRLSRRPCAATARGEFEQLGGQLYGPAATTDPLVCGLDHQRHVHIGLEELTQPRRRPTSKCQSSTSCRRRSGPARLAGPGCPGRRAAAGERHEYGPPGR